MKEKKNSRGEREGIRNEIKGRRLKHEPKADQRRGGKARDLAFAELYPTLRRICRSM